MEPLSPEFLASCRRENGMIIRGDNMTRIETFVDAAFAFAFTMLVISIDEVPRSPVELYELSKDIPAFIGSTLTIGAIWMSHSAWSRVFGLQDRITIYLSLALVMLVLIFVYPLKLIFQATVLYLSVVFFETDALNTGLFDNAGWDNNEVAGLFVYVALGLIALALIIIAFFQNALRYQQQLQLNAHEKDYCYQMTLVWIVVAFTAVLSCVAANIYDAEQISRAGFVYFLLFFTIPLVRVLYKKFAVSS